MFKELVIQVDFGQTTVALLEDGRLAEFYLEQNANPQTVGNIYLGRVANVLPGMQAAFVDIGYEKNAFLYVADAQPPGCERSIKEILFEGQEILVQVIKEAIGSKGPRVTTNLTIPGSYLVLVTGSNNVGVSRRIENKEERERLKALAEGMRPDGVGLIIRTAALGLGEEDLVRDFNQLLANLREVEERLPLNPAPCLIWCDMNLVRRVLRDILSPDIERITINSQDGYQRLLQDLRGAYPVAVRLQSTPDLLEEYGLYAQLTQVLKKRVWLKNGGYLVIDQTEALTVIDVNTGKFVGKKNLEDTVLQTNIEAAGEIARQLRLRNIGGIIIIDFIDMPRNEDQEAVLASMNEELKKDRVKTAVLGLTRLGLVELTRKKVREGLEGLLLKECPNCEGRGRVLSEAMVAARAERDLAVRSGKSSTTGYLIEANPKVAAILIGVGGSHLKEIERDIEKSLLVKGDPALAVEETRIREVTAGEIEQLIFPVQVGDVLKVKVEARHVTHASNGIARLNGYLIDIAGASELVDKTVNIEITSVQRTFARARIVPEISARRSLTTELVRK